MMYAQTSGAEGEGASGISRGLIPEELLRPRREESPRYPIDTVIGALGQGGVPAGAYQFAREVAAALCTGNREAASLSAMNAVFLENYLSTLEKIDPRSFRLGGGREEPDGSFSFLIRFIGREQGITGELFIRYEDQHPAQSAGENEETSSQTAEATGIPVRMVWIFEDLILEEARDRETENRESRHRFDFSPYERFF